ncbi:MAG: hypothetical protein IKZ03_05015, partial [Clostridia bacterium]|nr:hypothetical protein [Clostridia bacterium]
GLTNGGVVRKKDTGDSRGVYYWHDELGWDIPGVKTNRVSDYYSMIAWGTKLGFPSIIVEHAYLSNKSDLAFCDSEGGLEKMAEAEAEAIIKYFTGHVHTYGAETCDRRANCCLEGVYSRKCTTCGHRTDVRRTPKDGNVHGWTYDSKAVSCTEDGYEKKECQISRNLSEKGYQHISIHTESTVYPATGHSFITEVDTPAGHAVDGLFRQVCTTCGFVDETVRYGDPHIYVTVDSSPVSCTEAGHDTYECTVCRDTYTDEYPATGHTYESDGEALTCASDGTKEYTCTVCGDVMSENVEIPPHTFEVALDTAPTCTDDGVRLERCSVCGLEKRETLPATGHDFSGEAEERLAPTYFARGERVFVCKNDSDHIMVEAIAKKAGGLVMIAVAVAAVAVVALVIALVAVKRKGASVPVKAEADTADTDADASPAEEKEETEV